MITSDTIATWLVIFIAIYMLYRFCCSIYAIAFSSVKFVLEMGICVMMLATLIVIRHHQPVTTENIVVEFKQGLSVIWTGMVPWIRDAVSSNMVQSAMQWFYKVIVE